MEKETHKMQRDQTIEQYNQNWEEKMKQDQRLMQASLDVVQLKLKNAEEKGLEFKIKVNLLEEENHILKQNLDEMEVNYNSLKNEQRFQPVLIEQADSIDYENKLEELKNVYEDE